MKTSTSLKTGNCPKCKDKVSEDKKSRGYVRHLKTKNCSFERGQRDKKYIVLRWHTDDVLEIAKKLGKKLSVKKANEILDTLKNNHVENGISNDTIIEAINLI